MPTSTWGGYTWAGNAPAQPGATADSLLASIVAYLKATTAVTALLATPGSIYTGLSNWGQEIPFVLLEGYDEDLPGLSTEDEPVEVHACVYAGDLDTLRTIVEALKAALDTPNINPASTRTGQFTWSRGATTGCTRDRTMIDRTPALIRGGRLCYQAKIQYVFWINTNA